VLVATLCFLIAGVAASPDYSELVPRTLRLEDGTEVSYTLALPDDLDPGGATPLVLALHYGWGGGDLPQYFGMTFLTRLFAPALEELEAIIVAPDCPARDWHHPRSQRAIWAILEAVQSEYEIDPKRRLITGFSLGGTGTWYIAAEHPDTFSAAIAIATAPTVASGDSTFRTDYQRLMDGGTVLWRESLAATPFFVIHSTDDQLIPFAPIARALDSLAAWGASIEFLAIDGPGHYDIELYIEPLSSAIPWVRRLWSRDRP
jgi:predicted peptidase